jgi:DhnA family fructose-bisphosphate aldolase class Ia
MAETVTAPTTSAGGRTIRERIAEITELRVNDPEAIARAARARVRRPTVRGDGRLMLVAADHPARGAFGVGDRPLAMGSRIDLLDRLVTALARPGVDGLLGTPDILEDLLLLGALEDKVVIGSMNRGGLQGAEFELDDRFTGYDARGCAEMGLNGGKMLTRIALDDRGTVATMQATAQAVNELAERRLMAMVEPFWSIRRDGRVVNDLTPDAVIKSIGITSALGRTSAYTWMKLPVVAQMERVMDSTTLPTLLLGGDPATSPEETFQSWRAALDLPAVRGLVVGRTLLYPADDDVATAVDTAVSMIR